jgi:hypothetical protein
MAWGVTVGTPTSDIGTVTPGLPFGVTLNDILFLIMQVREGPPDFVPAITDTAGGTWTAFTQAAPAVNGPRLAVWWARYNGTQTAPTLSDSGDHGFAVIVGVRGALISGSPINVSLVGGAVFAETTTTLSSITSSAANCLVLAIVGLEGPDWDGSNNFSNWTNSVSGVMTEVLDQSSSAGVGGSIGVAYVIQASAGVTGTTTNTHVSLRAAWLHVAVSPTTVQQGDAVLTQTLENVSLVATGTAAGGAVLNQTLANVTLVATGTVAAGGGPGSGSPPTYVGAGALAADVGPITPALPAGILTDDFLMLPVNTDTTLGTGIISIPTPNGGTWTQLATLGGNGNRLTLFYSFYNGTQGAPTTSDSGDHQIGRIYAFRGNIVGAGAINAFAGNAPFFAETSTAIGPAGAFEVITTVSNCLIVDIIAGDINAGTGYAFTNGGLTSMTERGDDTSAVGLGGTLALNTGIKAVAGLVQETVATHASWRPVWGRIALAPIPGTGGGGGTPPVGYTVDAKGRILKDGTAMLGKMMYSPGLTGSSGTDMAGEIANRNFARWANKINFYINVMSGTLHNTLRLCDALLPYNINVFTICNAHGGATAEQMSAGNLFDAITDAGGFRALFGAKSNAAGYYVADEPSDNTIPSVVNYVTTFKTSNPALVSLSILIQDPIGQIVAWSNANTGEWIGCDPYPLGGAPETTPDGSTTNISTYGWMNFVIGTAAAHTRWHALRTGKAPWVILQLWKFGGVTRFITDDELWSHMVAVLAEGCHIGWWALGVQQGTIDEFGWRLFNGNGTQTVFPIHTYVEEAVDVEVEIAGVLQAPSAFTIQNLGDKAYFKSGNFYQLTNPPTVTMNTAPPVGTNNVLVRAKTWPSGHRTRALNMLEQMLNLLTSLEPTLLRDPSPELLTFNSTSTGNALLWRKNLCNELRSQAADRPVWLFGYIGFFQDQFTRLSLTPPDVSLSEMFFDQSGNVRCRCWVAADGSHAIIFAYNIHYNAQNNVTLQWANTVTRVEVMGEGRDCALLPDNRSWVDTFGGGSSLRQGFRRQGHVYRLSLTGAPPPSAPGPPVLTSLGPVSTTVNRLSMEPGSGATTHDLYRGTATGFARDAGHLIAAFGVTPPSTYDDTGLTPSTQYFYKLVARNATGNTESFEISITTLTPQVASTGLFWNTGAQDFVSWPGHLRKAQVGTYEFQLQATGGRVQPSVSGYRVLLDAEDITETSNDVAIAVTTGSRLPLTNVYRVIKSVIVTLVNDGGAAVTARVMDKNPTTGPLIQCFSSAGAVVAGHVDATVIGY